ncbi:unnamed protein product, partial [Rhizoctonia solani]
MHPRGHRVRRVCATGKSRRTDNPVSFLPREVIWHPDVTIPTSFALAERLSSDLSVSPQEAGDPGMTHTTDLSYPTKSGDCSTEGHTQDVTFLPARKWSNSPCHPQPVAPEWAHESISEDEEEEDEEDDSSDKQEMCVVPVLDANTTENTLPFILQCYARWIKLVLFEPSRGAHPLKENIVNRFMQSPGDRPRIILLANAIGSLGKSITPNPKATSLVAYLGTEAYWHLNRFTSDKPASDREVDRRNASDALDLVMEVILIQRYFHSLFTLTKFMEVVAPVFRRACPEPMNQYVNLPRATLSTDINIRNFATGDVILSATTGRPMLFRYDMTCPPDVLERLNDGKSGMQWLHGIPDQYILILARINILVEELEFGDAVSSHCVAEIEKQIREVKSPTELLVEPIEMVWRYTVRECWRLAMYVYLYMVLCRASTDAPRVLESVKSYIRILQAVKPGRNPDAFLYLPMIILSKVGASAYDKQDRMVIWERMLGLPECTNPGCSGYDVMKASPYNSERQYRIHPTKTIRFDPCGYSESIDPHVHSLPTTTTMTPTKSTTGCLKYKSEQEECDQNRHHYFRGQQSCIECSRHPYTEDPNKMDKEPWAIPALHSRTSQSPVTTYKGTPLADTEELAWYNAMDNFQVASARTQFELMNISDKRALPALSGGPLQECPIACSSSNSLATNTETSEPARTPPNTGVDVLMDSDLAGRLEESSSLEFSELDPLQCTETRSGVISPLVSRWSPPGAGRQDDFTIYDDEDLEGAISPVHHRLVLDRTAESNALPFVLQAYVTWVTRIAFDPLKVKNDIREFVYNQFEDGDQSRWTVALLANIGNRIGSEEFVEGKHSVLLYALQTMTQRRLRAINSCASPKRPALAKALAYAIEAMVIYFFTNPVTLALTIKHEAAPIFRQLCSEPPNVPINLLSLLQHPLGCLGQYAYIDIFFGVLMDIPTLFRYEVVLPAYHPYRTVSAIQSDGIIQWMRGIPNQLVLVFAHMQSMRQDGLTPKKEVVALLEREIRELPMFNGSSSDRFLVIMRSVVQECWRQAAFIYLYMAVCGDPSDTARVQQAFRHYIKLLNGTKPGRLPDEFLILTLQLIYPAAQRPRDREVIKQRVYSRDRTRVATTSILSIMDNVWGRADAEGRPIMWSDVAASQREKF